MDFNDLHARLDRTLSSFDSRFEINLRDNLSAEVNEAETEKSVSLVIGDDTQSEMTNKIFLILYNLAILKDHVANALRKKSLNGNLIETEINNSLHLQILVDLVNQDKHGYPLTKTNRSNKNPILTGINQVIEFSNDRPMPLLESGEPDILKFLSQNEPSVSMNFGGEVGSSGNNKTVIRAEISDDKHNLLFSIDELIEECYSKFDSFIKRHSLA